MIMGFSIIGSSILSIFIRIKGHSGLIGGKDSDAVKADQALQIPDEEEA